MPNRELGDATVGVECEGMRDLTWVVIEEVKQGDWAIGGNPVFPKAKSAAD
jgi:4-oxalocrotonate tautomerase